VHKDRKGCSILKCKCESRETGNAAQNTSSAAKMPTELICQIDVFYILIMALNFRAT